MSCLPPRGLDELHSTYTRNVAARFGVSQTIVAKRLKLGRSSPVILAAYGDGTTVDLMPVACVAGGTAGHPPYPALRMRAAAVNVEAQERQRWPPSPHKVRSIG